MDKDGLLELARRCEKEADHHFNKAFLSGDLSMFNNIDRGLECLARAAALRASKEQRDHE